MDVVEAIPTRSAGLASVSDSTDSALLQAIRVQRSQDAFEILFLRHQESAYNLAYHILQDSALAEEAVQEAMLFVWLARKIEFGDREPREWIFGVVAGKSLNLRRRKKRQSRRESAFKIEACRTGDDIPAEDDVLSTLRRHIALLPESDSQLLACSFGANLPHRTIGRLMGLPKSTISLRIQRALDSLRASLKQAGLAGLMPLLPSDQFAAAFRQGLRIPPTLEPALPRVARRNRNPARDSKRSRSRLRKSSSIQPLRWIAAPAIICTGFLCAACATSIKPAPASAAQLVSPAVPITPSAQPETPVRVTTPPVTAAPEIAAPAPKAPSRLYQHWSFEHAPARDFVAFEGKWEWRETGPAKGMAPVGDDPVCVCLPPDLGAAPIKVTLKTRPYQGNDGKTRLMLSWLDASRPSPFEFWTRTRHYRKQFEASTIEIYFDGRYAVQFENGDWYVLHRYQSPHLGQRLFLLLKHTLIQEITIEALDPADRPAPLRDPVAAIAKFNYTEHGFE